MSFVSSMSDAPEYVTVDLISMGSDGKTVNAILVEQGPWSDTDLQTHLRRLQERLYACFDAIVEGMLAAQYPDTVGLHANIRLDCYNLPKPETRQLFEAVSAYLQGHEESMNQVLSSPYISSISFEINERELGKRAAR